MSTINLFTDDRISVNELLYTPLEESLYLTETDAVSIQTTYAESISTETDSIYFGDFSIDNSVSISNLDPGDVSIYNPPSIYGTNYNDVLYGTANSESIYAYGGDDIVYAGGGNDSIYGQAGNDTLDGWTGNDYVYGGDGNDTLYGWTGNDYLNGGFGNDTLYGEGDNDTLVGSFGNDVLWGGAGADKFVFNSKFEGIDIIKDFQWVEGDTIQIDKYGFGATSTSQFSYDYSNGALFFQGTQFVTVENKPSEFSVNLDIVLV